MHQRNEIMKDPIEHAAVAAFSCFGKPNKYPRQSIGLCAGPVVTLDPKASLHGVIGGDAGCRFAEPKHRHEGAIFGPKLGLPCMPALAQDLVLDLESSNRGSPPPPPLHPA
jgi:hypothetical protein